MHSPFQENLTLKTGLILGAPGWLRRLNVPTLDVGSGHDLAVREIESRSGPCAECGFSLSLSPSLCPARTLSLKKKGGGSSFDLGQKTTPEMLVHISEDLTRLVQQRSTNCGRWAQLGRPPI